MAPELEELKRAQARRVIFFAILTIPTAIAAILITVFESNTAKCCAIDSVLFPILISAIFFMLRASNCGNATLMAIYVDRTCTGDPLDQLSSSDCVKNGDVFFAIFAKTMSNN
jgi:hypothetical protein